MSIILNETFEALVDGATYTGFTNIGAADYKVTTYRPVGGTLAFGKTAAATGGDGIYTGMSAIGAQAVKISQKVNLDGSNFGANTGIILRSNDAWTNGYVLAIDLGDTRHKGLLFRKDSGSYTLIQDTDMGLTFDDNDTLHIIFEATGTTIRWKAWKNAAAMPTSWTFSTTNANHATGKVGFFGGANTDSAGTSGQSLDNWIIATTSADFDSLVVANLDVTTLTATQTTILAAATGAGGAYTYQWHKGLTADFTPGGGTSLAGETSASITVTTPTTGVHYYKCVVTATLDASSATTYVRPIYPTQPPLEIGYIGDSISTSESYHSNEAILDRMENVLREYAGLREITTSNASIGGTATNDWQVGGSNWNTMISAFETAFGGSLAGVYVFVRLGMNDAQGSVSSSTFNTRLSNIVNGLVSEGATVVLDYPTFREPGSHAPSDPGTTFTEAAIPLLESYQPIIDALINGTTILAGDKRSYSITAERPQDYLYDRIHPNDLGIEIMGVNDAFALFDALYPVSGGNGRKGGFPVKGFPL